MKSKRPLVASLFAALLWSGFPALHADHHESPVNQLTESEKAAGWALLFNGKSLDGWRTYRGTDIADGWTVQDGLLIKQAGVAGGNIITTKKFRDFELSWEWKVEPKGNNGLKYFVIEERPGAPGHEYQLLDDDGHPDGKVGPKRQTASFYDVLPPAADKVLNKPGEWNTSRLVVNGNTVQHWLNGKLVLEYILGSPEVATALTQSKFKNAKGFGDKVDGYIMLTDHQDGCAFRNIKLRELKPVK